MTGLRACFHPPSAHQGLSIGLFGGSFDPAHRGHRHLAQTASKRLGLSYVWWIPTLGHPLKASTSMPFSARLNAARVQAQSPNMRISSAEAHFGVRHTLQLVEALSTALPQARLVWLIGEDCLAQFHLWTHWQVLARTIPLAVIARPNTGPKARLSPFARQFASARLASHDAQRLAYRPAPAWLYLNAPYQHVSSRFLREGSGV